MARNPETRLTNRVRRLIESAGGHFVKISDQFTRGIPDAMVVTNRVVMSEFKIDTTKTMPPKSERTYKSLRLTGAQDHHIRQIARRTTCLGVCVITDTKAGDRLRLWIPLEPHGEGEPTVSYVAICNGWEEVAGWLGLATSQT